MSKLSERFKKEEKPLVKERTITPKPVNATPDFKVELLEKVVSIPVWFEYSRDKQRELVASFVANKSENLSDTEKNELTEDLFSYISGFGPLEFLIKNDNVSAVFVNGTLGVHIEINGKILDTEIKLTNEQLNFILNNISSKGGKLEKDVSYCQIDDLFITVISSNIAQDGTNLVLRKVRKFDVDDLIQKEMFNREIFEFLVSILNSGKNVVISGDINSGKTTLLKLLTEKALINKRCALLEEFPQINCERLMRFVVDRKNIADFAVDVCKMLPEYIILDFNMPVITDDCAFIYTINSPSIEAAIDKLTISYSEGLNEKLAKHRVLTEVDYIVQINKAKNGLRKITSIVELKPAKTAALSVRTIL